MPELPEVETIRRQLIATLPGKRIARIEVRRAKSYRGTTELVGAEIQTISRVGKYLHIHFTDGSGWQVHLKMTGRLVYDVSVYAELPHTRIVVSFTDGTALYFHDTRVFGYFAYFPALAKVEQRLSTSIGPEPWKIEAYTLWERLQRTRRPIKVALLDQALIAGVGNIYANDALWQARIHPQRMANSLQLAEVERLLASLRQVLARGLMTGGASDNSYVNARGEKGSYQDEFLVYGRSGAPCLCCGTPLIRIVVGGRGTWVCELCQKS
jgi:formamidopyrimidine-DNA glycosylase